MTSRAGRRRGMRPPMSSVAVGELGMTEMGAARVSGWVAVPGPAVAVRGVTGRSGRRGRAGSPLDPPGGDPPGVPGSLGLVELRGRQRMEGREAGVAGSYRTSAPVETSPAQQTALINYHRQRCNKRQEKIRNKR